MLKKLVLKALGAGGDKQDAKVPSSQTMEKKPLTKNLHTNRRELQKVFESCGDVVFRDLELGSEPPVKILIVYADTLIDQKLGSQNTLEAIIQESMQLNSSGRSNAFLPQTISNRMITAMQTHITSDIVAIADFIMQGGIAVICEGCETAVIAMAGGGKERPIKEPDSEPVVRGPKDGFVEDYKVNISLVRRRIVSTRLKVEVLSVGEISKTAIAVCYVKGIVKEQIVQEVKQRIEKIKIDAVIGSSVIEELIADRPFSMFPLSQYTERPDKAASALMEGQVLIIVNNTPVALIVPITFVSLLQASEDYYNQSFFATFIRVLRFVALNIALLLPAITISILSFNHEVIPDKLFLSITNTRQGLPFPLFVEVLFLELTFEILREAGIRLPRPIGQAVSIVGGLVVGQASMDAKLVGAIPVVVVSLTAIASFTMPNYPAGTSIRILRFLLIFAAALFGGVGIAFVLMIILFYLCGLRSFGIPYLSPIAPFSFADQKDTILRAPWWAMVHRPKLLGAKNPTRQAPPEGEEQQ